jgi:hypothetical protein
MALFFDWGTFVNTLSNIGAFKYLFPFLLALAIFYGILMWAAGERLKKGPTGLISIVLAFFVMLFASSTPWIDTFFAQLGGMTLIVASGILVIVILLGLVGFKIENVFSGTYSKWFLVFAIIIIGLIIFYGAGGGYFISMPYFFISSEFTTAIIVIIIIAVAMWFMTRGEEKPKEEAPKKT